MAPSKKTEPQVIDIPTTDIGQFQTGVLGLTPYLHNRMAEKARHELLFPKGRKNAADKAAHLKHEPVEEFRSSPYLLDTESPTRLGFMASAIKGAMMTAALDLPGVNKSQVGRLLWVEGHYLPMWGSAFLHMSVTRSADMGRTPDIRTRAITPQWGTIITVSYVKPLVTQNTVVNLLTTGGRSAGVGDWRSEKGKGTFGQFKLVAMDDPELKKVMKLSRKVQEQALEDALPYDAESTELLSWFATERKERGK